MKIKKTAFLVSSLDSGGIENYLLRFLSHYQGNIDAVVYCKAGYEGVLVNEFRNLNVRVIPFRLGYFNPLQYIKFYKEIKFQKFDSIVDFTGNMAGLIMLVSRVVSIKKRIVFYRNSSVRFSDDFFRKKYDEFVKILVRKNATNILANSIAGLDFYHFGIWKENPKYQVIYNGIDANKFLSTDEDLRKELNIPKDAFVVGHIGRFNPAKNHKTIIETAIILVKRKEDVYVVLCGDKVDVALQERINNEKLQEKIKILGYRKDVINVLNTLNCFYFPSITEGQPNALIEAMFVDLPFVASNIDSIKETVPEKLHSQLIEPNNVKLAIVKILEIYERRENLGIKDWAINYFNPDKWFEDFFQKI